VFPLKRRISRWHRAGTQTLLSARPNWWSAYVRKWPKADIAVASANARFWVKSGHVQVPIITLIGSYAVRCPQPSARATEPLHSSKSNPPVIAAQRRCDRR